MDVDDHEPGARKRHRSPNAGECVPDDGRRAAAAPSADHCTPLRTNAMNTAYLQACNRVARCPGATEDVEQLRTRLAHSIDNADDNGRRQRRP